MALPYAGARARATGFFEGSDVLYAFGFNRLAVLIGDLYFLDPDPNPGQEGAERGVRLELRLLDREPLRGSIYSAQPIGVREPIWRLDLLEAVESMPGSFNRTHHHPAFNGWEPGRRNFVEDLSADPLGWTERRLSDPERLLAEAGVSPDTVDADDLEQLRRELPEIMSTVRRLLARVHAGEAGVAPPGADLVDARIGWL